MSYINKVNGRQSRTHIDKDAILLPICIYRQLLLGIRERSEHCRVVTAVSWSDIFNFLFLFSLYFLENRRRRFTQCPFFFPKLLVITGPFGFYFYLEGHLVFPVSE